MPIKVYLSKDRKNIVDDILEIRYSGCNVYIGLLNIFKSAIENGIKKAIIRVNEIIKITDN